MSLSGKETRRDKRRGEANKWEAECMHAFIQTAFVPFCHRTVPLVKLWLFFFSFSHWTHGVDRPTLLTRLRSLIHFPTHPSSLSSNPPISRPSVNASVLIHYRTCEPRAWNHDVHDRRPAILGAALRDPLQPTKLGEPNSCRVRPKLPLPGLQQSWRRFWERSGRIKWWP